MPLTSLPTYDDVFVLPAHNALTVPPDFEDRNGHMNIAHYLTVASWGVEYAMQAAGVAPDRHETEGLGFFTAEHHIVYLREVHVGSEVSVRVRFLGRSARALHLQAFLLDDTHQDLAYVLEVMAVHIDFRTRRTTPWPEALSTTWDGLIGHHDSLSWPAPLSGSMALR